MKLVKVILTTFTILVVLPNNLSAQSNCFYGCYYHVDDVNKKHYVYSDVANVRTSPDINSEISFKLSAGQEVVMISYNDKLNVIDGFSGYWFFIEQRMAQNAKG